MKNSIAIITFLALLTNHSFSQYMFGTNMPHPNAIATFQSVDSSKILRLPITPTSKLPACITGNEGLIAYDLNDSCVKYCNGVEWNCFGSGNGTLTGIVSSLLCANAVMYDTLIEGNTATNVTVRVPYTGGNGGQYNGTSDTSTGVLGLTATLSGGTLASGNDSLTYVISGTPSTSGTASFSISIGGQSCVLNLDVTDTLWPTGYVHCGTPTIVNPITNPITERTWMDRNLGASSPSDPGDLYQWGRLADGHQCRTSSTTLILSNSDIPGHGDFIIDGTSPSDWRDPKNDNLWQGVNGVNNPCPQGYRLPTDIEWNDEISTWVGTWPTGIDEASNSFLSLPTTGARNGSSGGAITSVSSIGRYWAGSTSVNNGDELFFDSNPGGYTVTVTSRSRGNAVRCIKDVDSASIASISCINSVMYDTLISGYTATNVTVKVPYTGGNGGQYFTSNDTSTGVLGLTATLSGGTLASGNDSLTYVISGTPNSIGTASFNISIGGQSCTFNLSVISIWPSGYVHCGTPTVINPVTNPLTGETWMDRNLGASSPSDPGDLYQWGRFADGHQCRTSSVTYTLSTTDTPGHGDYIVDGVSSPWDWRSPMNDNLWQGVNGVNNPCPQGYRLPTATEWNTEISTWSGIEPSGSDEAANSFLALPETGFRNGGNGGSGGITSTSISGWYYTSTISGTAAGTLYFDDDIMFPNYNVATTSRSWGNAIRCIKD